MILTRKVSLLKNLSIHLGVFLIVFAIPSEIIAQNVEYQFMSWNFVGGSETSKVKDLDVDVKYSYSWQGFEAEKYEDGFFYRASIFTSLTSEGKHDDEGKSYNTSNGSLLNFAMGTYNIIDDNLAYGFGMKADFLKSGIEKYDGKTISAVAMDLGFDFPVTFAVNDLIKVQGIGTISNVWSEHKVLGGYKLDLSSEIQITPFPFMAVGAGINYYNRKSTTEDDYVYKQNSFFWNLFVAISFSGGA